MRALLASPRWLFGGLLAASLGLAADVAVAQWQPRGGGSGDRPGRDGSRRGRFDPSRMDDFLNRLDTNHNGMLDADEVSGPRKPFIEGMLSQAGVEPNYPIPLSKIRDAMTKALQARGGQSGPPAPAAAGPDPKPPPGGPPGDPPPGPSGTVPPGPSGTPPGPALQGLRQPPRTRPRRQLRPLLAPWPPLPHRPRPPQPPPPRPPLRRPPYARSRVPGDFSPPLNGSPRVCPPGCSTNSSTATARSRWQNSPPSGPPKPQPSSTATT